MIKKVACLVWQIVPGLLCSTNPSPSSFFTCSSNVAKVTTHDHQTIHRKSQKCKQGIFRLVLTLEGQSNLFGIIWSFIYFLKIFLVFKGADFKFKFINILCFP